MVSFSLSKHIPWLKHFAKQNTNNHSICFFSQIKISHGGRCPKFVSAWSADKFWPLHSSYCSLFLALRAVANEPAFWFELEALPNEKIHTFYKTIFVKPCQTKKSIHFTKRFFAKSCQTKKSTHFTKRFFVRLKKPTGVLTVQGVGIKKNEYAYSYERKSYEELSEM